MSLAKLEALFDAYSELKTRSLEPPSCSSLAGEIAGALAAELGVSMGSPLKSDFEVCFSAVDAAGKVEEVSVFADHKARETSREITIRLPEGQWRYAELHWFYNGDSYDFRTADEKSGGPLPELGAALSRAVNSLGLMEERKRAATAKAERAAVQCSTFGNGDYVLKVERDGSGRLESLGKFQKVEVRNGARFFTERSRRVLAEIAPSELREVRDREGRPLEKGAYSLRNGSALVPTADAEAVPIFAGAVYLDPNEPAVYSASYPLELGKALGLKEEDVGCDYLASFDGDVELVNPETGTDIAKRATQAERDWIMDALFPRELLEERSRC